MSEVSDIKIHRILDALDSEEVCVFPDFCDAVREVIAELRFERQRVSFDLPDDVIESLVKMGPVEWGTTHSQDDEKHVSDLRDTLRLTREHFGTKEEETAMHGLYLEGTGVVLAHTGNSPNSPNHARILAGAWNQLVNMAKAQRETA